MIPYILLPRFFKWLGFLLVVVGFSVSGYYKPELLNVKSGLALFVQASVLIGLLLISCAREKFEDEFIKYYRLISLQWAVVLLIALRLLYKIIAWYNQDESWSPNWQMNALLWFYLLFFYYQVHVKEYVLKLLKKENNL